MTSYAVLGLLSLRSELSGYDIKKLADHSIGLFYWAPAMSNIYAELRRLEGLGYVEPLESDASDTRNRRRVRITPAGHAELSAWLPEPLPSSVVSKDNLLLKVWMGQAGEIADLVALIDQENAAVGQTLASATYNIERLDELGDTGYSSIVYRFCSRMAEARLAALEELKSELAVRTETPNQERDR